MFKEISVTFAYICVIAGGLIALTDVGDGIYPTLMGIFWLMASRWG